MPAVQDLIESFPELPGCVLTLDALHTVKETFRAVVSKQADFLVCVKGNASDLERKLHRHLNRRRKTLLRAGTLDRGHGRIEKRSIEIAPLLPSQTDWPHTHIACRVTRERCQIRRSETVQESREQVLYVGSFPVDRYSPERVLGLVRGHWSIENCLHHRKDRSMDEDRNRAQAGKSGRVMCCLRSIAAMVLGRAKEALSVLQRRFSAKPQLVLGLLSCSSLAEWERRYKPYKLA